MTATLSFNPNARVTVQRITPEAYQGEPALLLVVDDCLLATECLLQTASDAVFSQQQDDFYPGLRAELPAQYQSAMLQGLADCLNQTPGGSPPRLQSNFAAFSMATQDSRSLLPIQCIPHFDNTDSSQFALVHYLFTQDLGGTGFFQHRKTGYWQITPTNQAHYMKSLGTQATTEGLPEAAYIQGSTPLFEEYLRVEPRFNRAILYPSNLLHSGLINNEAGLSRQPDQARLTANMAIQLAT